MNSDSRPTSSSVRTNAPLSKRMMRSLWLVLPRSKFSFNAGKFITRTLLRPAPEACEVNVLFAKTIPMTLDLRMFVANDLFCLDDHFESVTMRLWRALARDAGVILDVGSHIGTFGLAAADANPRAKVMCIEADKKLFSLLKRHTARFSNIIPVHAAIADKPSQMWFCSGGTNDGGGFISATRPENIDSYPIATHTLTELCHTHKITSIDLMKMDVEGFEHTLLVCADEFFEEFAPKNLIVELTIDKQNRARSEEVFRAMKRRGYVARRIQGLYAVPFGQRHDLANWQFELQKAIPPRQP